MGEEQQQEEEEGILMGTVEDQHHERAYHNNRSCRICHEEEEEDEENQISQSCRELEAPCACSGTAKFAHRECVQRWCNIKGDTTCEICKQNYEPNYTTPPPKKDKTTETLPEEVVTIRGGFEIPRGEEVVGDIDENIFIEAQVSVSAVERSAAFCKSVAVMLTVLLLARQLLAVLTGREDQNYPFSPITVFALRASGIILPMLIIICTLNEIQRNIRRQRLHYLRMLGHNNDEHLHVTLDIQSN